MATFGGTVAISAFQHLQEAIRDPQRCLDVGRPTEAEGTGPGRRPLVAVDRTLRPSWDPIR